MEHKAGFVNILGKPNAGKSTLMNALMGEKFSIVSPKVQTTRHRILGILNDEHSQIVYSDTPGLLVPKYKLQEKMLSFISSALEDADIFVLLIDVADPEFQFEEVLQKLHSAEVPLILILNKIDLINQEKLEAATAKWHEKFPKAIILPMSALHGLNVDFLQQKVKELLPESPPYFPKDEISDRPMRFFVSEMIREKIFENYRQEIPYATQVEIESYKEEGNLVRISALIMVERQSQKGILIGHGGLGLKKVGTEARMDMEKFLKRKVFLELHVKVDEDWRSKDLKLRRYGYNA